MKISHSKYEETFDSIIQQQIEEARRIYFLRATGNNNKIKKSANPMIADFFIV